MRYGVALLSACLWGCGVADSPEVSILEVGAEMGERAWQGQADAYEDVLDMNYDLIEYIKLSGTKGQNSQMACGIRARDGKNWLAVREWESSESYGPCTEQSLKNRDPGRYVAQSFNVSDPSRRKATSIKTLTDERVHRFRSILPKTARAGLAFDLQECVDSGHDVFSEFLNNQKTAAKKSCETDRLVESDDLASFEKRLTTASESAADRLDKGNVRPGFEVGATLLACEIDPKQVRAASQTLSVPGEAKEVLSPKTRAVYGLDLRTDYRVTIDVESDDFSPRLTLQRAGCGGTVIAGRRGGYRPKTTYSFYPSSDDKESSTARYWLIIEGSSREAGSVRVKVTTNVALLTDEQRENKERLIALSKQVGDCADKPDESDAEQCKRELLEDSILASRFSRSSTVRACASGNGRAQHATNDAMYAEMVALLLGDEDDDLSSTFNCNGLAEGMLKHKLERIKLEAQARRGGE